MSARTTNRLRAALAAYDAAPVSSNEFAQAIGEFFAACDPDTIRALLAERDELLKEREESRKALCAATIALANAGDHLLATNPLFAAAPKVQP